MGRWQLFPSSMKASATESPRKSDKPGKSAGQMRTDPGPGPGTLKVVGKETELLSVTNPLIVNGAVPTRSKLSSVQPSSQTAVS